ncbi:MAG TPA: hypothetical protein VKV18_00765, partial [Chthonomonas sp.]|uniref:hypothetical protein n=1 Tax=Chthonomonas sp. TaxID=2282153 RepID=UPI002B4B1F0A
GASPRHQASQRYRASRRYQATRKGWPYYTRPLARLAEPRLPGASPTGRSVCAQRKRTGVGAYRI